MTTCKFLKISILKRQYRQHGSVTIQCYTDSAKVPVPFMVEIGGVKRILLEIVEGAVKNRPIAIPHNYKKG
jgi:hypothetical protein